MISFSLSNDGVFSVSPVWTKYWRTALQNPGGKRLENREIVTQSLAIFIRTGHLLEKTGRVRRNSGRWHVDFVACHLFINLAYLLSLLFRVRFTFRFLRLCFFSLRRGKKIYDCIFPYTSSRQHILLEQTRNNKRGPPSFGSSLKARQYRASDLNVLDFRIEVWKPTFHTDNSRAEIFSS